MIHNIQTDCQQMFTWVLCKHPMLQQMMHDAGWELGMQETTCLYKPDISVAKLLGKNLAVLCCDGTLCFSSAVKVNERLPYQQLAE